MKTPSKGWRGFTLIELLVVIAVIALLIGILLPALGKARRSAQSAKNLANIRSGGLAFSLYANEFKSWFPVVPIPTNFQSRDSLNGQFVYGGLAGLFSLYQLGDGIDRGFGANGNPDTNSYANRSTTPIMRPYTDGFSWLVNPLDKEDRLYHGDMRGFDLAALPSYASAKVKQPKPPSAETEVISYNISYLYIAGLKTDEPVMLNPVPFFGDETNGPDLSTSAFYGGGGANQGNAAAAGTTPGYYAPGDNYGKDGGAFVFTDGHAAFIKQESDKTIQDIFFSRDTNRFPLSINAVQRNRSNFVQTID